MVNDEDKIKPVVHQEKPSIGKFSKQLLATKSTPAEDNPSTIIKANKGELNVEVDLVNEKVQKKDNL